MTSKTSATEQAVPAPEGVDLEALARYLPTHVSSAEGPLTAELISGGKSNLTYYVRSRHGEWVLRRPPLGHVLPTAHDMAREFRVISALEQTEVPVPKALVLCEDADVIGAPFYVMERAHGIIMHDEIPAALAPEPEDRRRMSAAFIDALADLAYALMYWVQAGDSELRAAAMDRGWLTMAEGFMSRDELVARYEQRTGRPLANFDFYTVFALYKLAIIVAGIHARYVKGQTLGEGFEEYGTKLRLLAELAWQVANESRDPVLRGARTP